MNKKKIKVLKLICVVFSLLWTYRILTIFYHSFLDSPFVSYNKYFCLNILTFWLGVALSLIVSGGFTTIFWYSYITKYNGEKIFDNLGKKILAFFITVSIFNFAFGIPIYLPALFFTLAIFIRQLEKEQSYQNRMDNSSPPES